MTHSKISVKRAIGGGAVALVLALSVAGFAGCGAPSSEKLYQDKCSACHSLNAIPSSASAKSGEWEGCVKRMQDMTTTISDEDAAAITAYLEEKYPGE